MRASAGPEAEDRPRSADFHRPANFSEKRGVKRGVKPKNRVALAVFATRSRARQTVVRLEFSFASPAPQPSPAAQESPSSGSNKAAKEPARPVVPPRI